MKAAIVLCIMMVLVTIMLSSVIYLAFDIIHYTVGNSENLTEELVVNKYNRFITREELLEAMTRVLRRSLTDSHINTAEYNRIYNHIHSPSYCLRPYFFNTSEGLLSFKVINDKFIFGNIKTITFQYTPFYSRYDTVVSNDPFLEVSSLGGIFSSLIYNRFYKW